MGYNSSNQMMIDVGDGTYITLNQARRDVLEAKQRQLDIAKLELRWLCERAQRDADFWQHAGIFYDRFFGALSPSYPFTVAAMEQFAYITPSMRQQLIAHTPGDRNAEKAGLVAGIAVGFWIQGGWKAGSTAFTLGTRSHLWTPGASFSLLAVDANKLSKGYGLFNAYFKIPGRFEKVITLNNANVLAIPKFIVAQMGNQVRGAIERSQNHKGGR